MTNHCGPYHIVTGHWKGLWALWDHYGGLTYNYGPYHIITGHWKGLWALWDHYGGLTYKSAATSVAMAVGLLLFLRASRAISEGAAPFYIAHDTTPLVFISNTRFEQHLVRRT